MARYIPGGRVVLADGTYGLGGSVSLNRQKAHLQGVGGATHLRPSTTGFTTLIDVDDIHCRIGYLLLFDSGDTVHDLRYAISDNTQFWTIIESVHTHGAEVIVRGGTGPAVIQHEFHGRGPGNKAINFFTDADGFGVSYGRVHGGWIEKPDHETIKISDGTECTVEGVHGREASMDGQGNYDMVRLENSTAYCTVNGCNFAGLNMPRYIVHETGNGTDNSILGNRLTGGNTSDLNLAGTGVSGGNYADGTIK